MTRPMALVALLATVIGVYSQSTPVIGGGCKIGMADVQIGGKQTQFFLKCEAASDSPEGDGVWVVKSRAASPPAAENVQHRPAKKPANPNICEQDNGARESDSCAVSAMCLQADQDNRVNYLQCDQTSMRWVKKSCQDTFVFNFEQQTCIIPRKLNNQPSQTNTSFDCSQCPLGTVCERGECTPAHGSTLCADGSAPLGACPCAASAQCTAKGVCCPKNRPCLHCSNAKPCPQPLTCNGNGCCEPRKHRHPSNLLPFESTPNLFDVPIVQGPSPGFRVMTVGPPAPQMVLKVEEARLYSPNHSGAPSEETTTQEAATTQLLARSTAAKYEEPGGASSLAVCMGQGDCLSSTDCPSSFLCEANCCRLSVCPGDLPVKFACSSNYQCGSGEKCLFGGCCALRKDEAVEENPYEGGGSVPKEEETPKTTPRPPRPTSMMPSFGPSDVCEVDGRVSNCSLAFPCPETSECMFGVCCRSAMARCSSGLLALSLPETCRADIDCPIASRCEYGRCCPSENAEITRNDELVPFILKTTTEAPVVAKPRCLQSPRCSSMSLCPPRFTCSLDGRCCRLDVLCPDGTVPEDSCDEAHLCPSSAQTCVKAGDQQVCCATGQQPMSGLTCTFSSCSNSNPCNQGTCNNGYCCTSGGQQQAPAIIANSTTNSSTSTASSSTITSMQEDWPIGPPGYGFPEALADLDSVLVPATGDGSTCAGGFESPLRCTVGDECPPGLACDRLLNLCCPLLLPLTDANNPTKPKSRRPIRADLGNGALPNTQHIGNGALPGGGAQIGDGALPVGGGAHIGGGALPIARGRPCCNFAPGNGGGCNGCNNQQPQPIILQSCPSGGYPVGQCYSGACSQGYQCVSGSCCPSYSAPAPQVQIFTCPSGGSPVGACISGACATGYTCQSGGCCPQTTTKNPFMCQDGTQAVGGCVNGKCGAGYTCQNGLCCAGTSTSVRCLDGSEAVGACIPSCQGNACGGSQLTYFCGNGYTCTTGNICCPVQSCPEGGSAIGPTVNGLCPTGYNAQNGICCSNMCADGTAGQLPVNNICPPGLALVNGVCCSGAATLTGYCGPTPDLQSAGPCNVAGSCGVVGYACNVELGRCCPAIDFEKEVPIGPAVAGMCPGGYVMINNPNIDADPIGSCYDLALIPGGCDGTSVGPCPDGQCEPGSGATCYLAKNQCCPPTAFRRIKPGQKKQSAFGRSLASYMPPRDMSCPDGSSASGGCMNGLCGLGMECVNGLCCPPQQKQNSLSSRCPNGESAVSGCFGDGSCGTGFECVTRVNLCCPPGGNEPVAPIVPQKSTIRPIGGRCFMDEECVGAGEGLSLCHAGVCQCSPIAYSQGIACIRRRAMVMNDEPLEAAVETNEVTKTA